MRSSVQHELFATGADVHILNKTIAILQPEQG